MTLALALLGSTGSIGRSTIEVVRHHPERLRVATLAAFGSDLDRLESQARELAPELVAVYDEERAREFARRLPDLEIVAGAEGVRAAATHEAVDRVVAAIVGAAGLAPTHAAVVAGKDVALANKEALVVAGPLLMREARARGVEIVPIDSEHVALHQALRCGAPHEVRRLILTASGGPFRQRPRESWDAITPQEALAHPTWEMGRKISIDSATLMNKGLELIEARHLFDVAPEAIDVVVHPQSQVHSMVEFADGSWIAQLSVNDMVFSVQYALSFPERWANDFPRLDPGALGALEFEPLDEERFRSISLARQAVAAGGSAPAVHNAVNEVAVHAFLDERIGFPAIVETVETVLDRHQPGVVESLEDALHWDAWGRRRANEELSGGT
ncbi:MAG: 1-deoxy-D-xylulose-5-phosphate reductoisomerase [Acidobacteria bacterium]|nr:1-deoxy-D-xylulose-5-phosphate reductoisomerase [Acidobacteriota bacterium]